MALRTYVVIETGMDVDGDSAAELDAGRIYYLPIEPKLDLPGRFASASECRRHLLRLGRTSDRPPRTGPLLRGTVRWTTSRSSELHPVAAHDTMPHAYRRLTTDREDGGLNHEDR